VAQNKAWFTTYTPFDSIVGSIHDDTKLQVVGIGTVHLCVKKNAHNGAGKGAHRTFVLGNVLHVPSSMCNIVGPIGDIRANTRDLKKTRPVRNSKGEILFCWNPKHALYAIKLSGPPVGPPVGPSVFLPGGFYLINAVWSRGERKRWKLHQRGGS
jgi:hypothetical protein